MTDINMDFWPPERRQLVIEAIREKGMDMENLSLYVDINRPYLDKVVAEMVQAGELDKAEIPARHRSYPRCSRCGIRLDLTDHWAPALRVPAPRGDTGICWFCEQEAAGVPWELSRLELWECQAAYL